MKSKGNNIIQMTTAKILYNNLHSTGVTISNSMSLLSPIGKKQSTTSQKKKNNVPQITGLLSELSKSMSFYLIPQQRAQTLMRKALSQKYFLKSLISASSKCSAVWLSVRVRVSDEWIYRREASSLSCRWEKPGERLPWKLKHQKSKPTITVLLISPDIITNPLAEQSTKASYWK